MPRLDVALLGPLGIKMDGKTIQTDRRKAIALLAYLAVTGKSHSRDQLAGLLWPDYERDSAYAYLRRTLWELNQVLGKGWIEADRETVQLIKDGAGFQLDILDFEDAIKQFNADGESVHLETAVTFYRGDFMTGFVVADTAPFEEWQNGQAEYFRREFAHALERLVETRTNTGEYESALPHARRWLTLDQLNESAQRAIMRILAGMGDRTGAIRQYETCVKTLKDELGIAPQPETEELYQAILKGEIVGAGKTVETVKQVERLPVSRLPQLPTPFIGRRPEVEQVKALVTDPNQRLVTLLGPGGIGKTRLSIQAASELEDMFPDGVFFAALAFVQNNDAVLPTVAKALNFSFYREEETPRQQLLNYLREKKLLLILDNFEHLLEASGLVTDILAHSANLKLIVTSRVRLNVQGEQLFNVTGMRIPTVAEVDAWKDPGTQVEPFSAVQLFLDRARRVQRDFRLTRENVHAVMEICSLVHGMPLALELAAAWLELLPPQEIATEISRSLDFLETDQADIPDRQRSIHAVFESSWKLLSEIEREAFLRLCVFVGSFSREAAQQVSGASLKILLGLANKSWLQQTDNGRFQLHELMRQYGEAELKKDEGSWYSAKNRHAEYYAGFVAEQSSRMRSAEQVVGLKALAEEVYGNVKTAWDWLVHERRWQDIIDRMVPGLIHYFLVRTRMEELIPWFREARVVLGPPANHAERLTFVILGTVEVLCEEGAQIKDADPIERLLEIWNVVKKYDLAEPMGFWFVFLIGLAKARKIDSDLEEAFDHVVARLRSPNTVWELGMAVLIHAGWWLQFNLDEEKLLEAAQIFKKLGVPFEQGGAAELLSKYAYQHRRPIAEVTAYEEQAKYFYQQLKGLARSGINLEHSVDMYFSQGEFARGFAILHEEQLEHEQRGNTRMLKNTLHWEALHAARYSTFEHALRVRERAFNMAREIGYQSDLAWEWLETAELYRTFGEMEKAAGAYEKARELFEKMNIVMGLGFCQRAQGDLALRNDHYEEALSHYQQYAALATTDNHTWSMVQARAKISLALAYLGDVQPARREMQNALAKLHDWRQDDLALQILLTEPVCLIHEGKLEAAVELAGFLQNYHLSWNETKQQAGAMLQTASRELSDDVVQSALERGKELELETVVESLVRRPTD